MPRHTGARAAQRHWWQRYPMFALAAGWVVIGVVMMAGVSQLHI
jgi:type VI protein secretion system component VasF